MKKLTFYLMAIAFVLGLGTAYAVDTSGNGVTDFTGRSYDTFEIAPIDRMDTMDSVEGAAPGGIQSEAELYNGATDFTGRSYDTFEIAPIDSAGSVKGESAGGSVAGDRALDNGVTDFSGRSYDTFEIG